MTERTSFTRQEAESLRNRRISVDLTQYELADQLGWPRSKIKRIERHEVVSINPVDLEALRGALGISAPPPKKKGPKADFGKPKPRLDYEGGMAQVLRVLQDAKRRGEQWLGRTAIEEVTGYTAVQVRTFCKALEAQGKLRRDGKYKGMRYRLLGSEPEPRDEDARANLRKTLDRQYRQMAKREIVPLLREHVKFPKWLMDVMMEHELDDLTLGEVWPKKRRGTR